MRAASHARDAAPPRRLRHVDALRLRSISSLLPPACRFERISLCDFRIERVSLIVRASSPSTFLLHVSFVSRAFPAAFHLCPPPFALRSESLLEILHRQLLHRCHWLLRAFFSGNGCQPAATIASSYFRLCFSSDSLAVGRRIGLQCHGWLTIQIFKEGDALRIQILLRYA